MEIYGTIGPACKDIEILTKMFQEGMNGLRLNVSHSSLTEAAGWISNIQKAAYIAGVSPQLLIDLQGPELRIGQLPSDMEGKALLEGKKIFLGIEKKEDRILIPKILFVQLKADMEVLIDDGKILLYIEEKNENVCVCKVMRGGILKSRKSIAVAGFSLKIQTLTESDQKNLKEAVKYGVTGVMLPFVRGKEDLINLRQALKDAEAEHIKIYAKIENQAGIDALEEIIEESDMIVIARGDLGNSMPLWELPAVQKQIAKKCMEKKKDFMVVTQMLASMENAKVPTRAEVSDIFNAVLDGAEAVMVTGETAVGKYPMETMEYLVKTTKSALLYIKNVR